MPSNCDVTQVVRAERTEATSGATFPLFKLCSNRSDSVNSICTQANRLLSLP
jgi:hypothetical protein